LPELTFLDGTTVRASSLGDRGAYECDFGLYLDARWEPSWRAELIEWQDFGLPRDPEEAARQITSAFARARSGERVEVGCVAGLGRTGTVLACMATLAGTPPSEAVSWVRSNYDVRAVETEEQEGWVEWFAAQALSK
jgi:protein-tyrosine phosphatase